MCLMEHICNFGVRYWNEKCRAHTFAEMFRNVWILEHLVISFKLGIFIKLLTLALELTSLNWFTRTWDNIALSMVSKPELPAAFILRLRFLRINKWRHNMQGTKTTVAEVHAIFTRASRPDKYGTKAEISIDNK